MDAGKFVELTFINTVTPPAIDADNLNEMQRVLEMTDDYLRRDPCVALNNYIEYFYMRNKKELEIFADVIDWTPNNSSYATLSDENDENVMNSNCVKAESLTAVASRFVGMYQTLSTPIDLTVFNDGSSSSTSDLMVLYIYIDDVANWGGLQLRVGDDFSNCYYYGWYASGLITGWNALYFSKASMTTIGTPTGWNSISYLRVVAYQSSSPNIGDYFYAQYLGIIREDPSYSGYPNIAQLMEESGFGLFYNIHHDVWDVYYDNYIDRLVLFQPNAISYVNSISVSYLFISFVAKMELYCMNPGYTNSFAWRIDSNNFVEVYISGDTLYLDATEASVLTHTSVALDEALTKHERVQFFVEKNYSLVRVIMKKGAESIKILEYITSFSNDTAGYMYFGENNSSNQGLIADFIISHSLQDLNLYNENNYQIIKKTITQEFANTTLTDIEELTAKLEPNATYEIKIYLSCNNSNNAYDIRVAWTLTNCEALSVRHTSGPASSSTDCTNTSMRKAVKSIGSSSYYGIDGSGTASSVVETILVKTGKDGGIAQPQAGQYSASATYPTTISFNSFMTIVKIH
jgi:hypothetical protein